MEQPLRHTSAAKSSVGPLAGDKIVQFPGAINPINAQIIEQEGFEGVYISGGAFSADQGLPDIGLTTLTEVAEHGRAISRVTNLPTFIDACTPVGAKQ